MSRTFQTIIAMRGFENLRFYVCFVLCDVIQSAMADVIILEKNMRDGVRHGSL